MPKASLNKLQTFVIAFVVIGVSGAVGLNILGSVSDASTETVSVVGESDAPAAPLPTNYTLDGSTTADFVEVSSETVEVTFQDTSRGTNTTLVRGEDFAVFPEEGLVTFASTNTEFNYDDTSDKVFTTYDYEEADTDARTGADNALSGLNEILGFLPVIGLVVAASVVVAIVRGIGGRYRNNTGRV